MTTIQAELQKTINDLVLPGKGILAADESTSTITKRFDAKKIPCSEDTRLAYRHMLFNTDNLNNYISGVILYEETLGQSTNGLSLPALLASKNIVPGIKVDKGLVPLANSQNEKTTQGWDNLHERLQEYKKQGARFAKWRAVYTISDICPSYVAIHSNADGLARYAAICQENGIVPIVEPELLMDGDHSIEHCSKVTQWALYEVFNALFIYGVKLEYIILKPSMVIAGNKHAQQSTAAQVAHETMAVLKRTVPSAVPSINFLSGGQTPQQATANLDAMNKLGPHPWHLSFSYGRALQEPALNSWEGKSDNIQMSQNALLMRAKLNSAATNGEYNAAMEKEAQV
ncbi:MAG: fructose-bisphosphate aldolase class I [Gammaproteobacteria bacterium]|nr:fructose-bisphosphate aldolase class I [Gammaproteobacteria bacterium]